jgi:DNA-binding Lrp family transcriptional regulator
MKQKLVILDQTTGEIRGEYKPRRTRRSRTKYFSIFYEALTEDKISLSNLTIRIIGLMDRYNRIVIDPREFRKIERQTGTVPDTIHNRIKRMRKANLIVRINKGEYLVNPYYFGKTNQYQLDTIRTEFDKLLRFNTEEQRKKTKLVLLKMSNESNETHLIIDDDEPL